MESVTVFLLLVTIHCPLVCTSSRLIYITDSWYLSLSNAYMNMASSKFANDMSLALCEEPTKASEGLLANPINTGNTALCTRHHPESTSTDPDGWGPGSAALPNIPPAGKCPLLNLPTRFFSKSSDTFWTSRKPSQRTHNGMICP